MISIFLSIKVWIIFNLIFIVIDYSCIGSSLHWIIILWNIFINILLFLIKLIRIIKYIFLCCSIYFIINFIIESLAFFMVISRFELFCRFGVLNYWRFVLSDYRPLLWFWIILFSDSFLDHFKIITFEFWYLSLFSSYFFSFFEVVIEFLLKICHYGSVWLSGMLFV